MRVACFWCGGDMGEIDAVPSEEIKVWYTLHDSAALSCGDSMMQSERHYFNEYVRKQNQLPRLGSAVRDVQAGRIDDPRNRRG